MHYSRTSLGPSNTSGAAPKKYRPKAAIGVPGLSRSSHRNGVSSSTHPASVEDASTAPLTRNRSDTSTTRRSRSAARERLRTAIVLAISLLYFALLVVAFYLSTFPASLGLTAHLVTNTNS